MFGGNNPHNNSFAKKEKISKHNYFIGSCSLLSHTSMLAAGTALKDTSVGVQDLNVNRPYNDSPGPESSQTTACSIRISKNTLNKPIHFFKIRTQDWLHKYVLASALEMCDLGCCLMTYLVSNLRNCIFEHKGLDACQVNSTSCKFSQEI